MQSPEIYASAGKVGTRYYWIVTTWFGPEYTPPLAEGFAPTKAEAEAAITAEASKLGIKPIMSAAYNATGFYKHYRANAKTGSSVYREVPESAELQGSPYLWSTYGFFSDGRPRPWMRHMITRVTSKYVYISDLSGVDPDDPDPDRSNIADCYVRLSRSDLEQHGRAAGKCWTWHTDVYFTASGRADHDKERAAAVRSPAEV
jgi:hypothetical protein